MDILSSEDILIPSGDSGRRRRPENRAYSAINQKEFVFKEPNLLDMRESEK